MIIGQGLLIISMLETKYKYALTGSEVFVIL